MHVLLLSQALAAPLPYDLPPREPSRYEPGDPAAVFGPLAVQARDREPVALQAAGSRFLDVYRAGDLAILHDADGEWFAEALANGADINWILGSMEGAFYKKFEDEYQYLTVLLVRDFGFFFAFYSPQSNDVRGIGYDSVLPSEVFDLSTTQMEGFIFMNYYGLWTESPEVGRFVFGQEFMHRWGSFVNIEKEGLDPNALLGRDNQHWSYYLHTPNSPMEGNTWLDNGDGTWTTENTGASTYSDLDLYLMGFLPPEEVGEQTLLLVDEAAADGAGVEPGSTPEYLDRYSGGGNVTLPGTPLTFGVDDIIAVEGPREPSVADSPKSFKMAFLVLVLNEDTFDESVIADIEGIRQTFEADWEEDVGHRADLDTTLGTSTAPEWGEPPDTGGDSGTIDCCKDGAESPDPIEGESPAACGCNGGEGTGAVGLLGVVLLGLVGAGRRRA